MGLRTCSTCKARKPVEEFPLTRRRKKNGVQSACRVCCAAVILRHWRVNRYVCAKRVAKCNGHELELSKEEYDALTALPCTYCKGPLSEIGVGLDKLDCSKGYAQGNVAPCCPLCNMTRGDRFTPEEMTIHLGPALGRVLEARRAAGLPLRIGKVHSGRPRGS